VGRTGEDDGYVVTIVTSAADCRAECWVFSARDIAKGPLAKVKLPARVPLGFHAKWVPGDRVWPQGKVRRDR
jgi:carotenoid cleavage dioxygenase